MNTHKNTAAAISPVLAGWLRKAYYEALGRDFGAEWSAENAKAVYAARQRFTLLVKLAKGKGATDDDIAVAVACNGSATKRGVVL